MNLDKLKSVLKEEPAYRFKQVWRAIFVDLIGSWEECTTLPKVLREKLNAEAPLELKAELFGSKTSESQKALITFPDGAKIETVMLTHKDGRKTVCVSSQVGCTMGCRFCATGKMGRERNLEAGEIVAQVLFFARHLKIIKDEHPRINNVVFMGMGEPFLNYDNVMSAIKILNDKEAMNIGARHISVSTCGIIPGIQKFAAEPLQLNLAISLHAPNDELRSSLMPINRMYPMKELLKAVDNYIDKTSRQVMFEYLMIEGVNDQEEHAEELAEKLNEMKNHLYIINLIRYNPTNTAYRASNPAVIKKFKNRLMRQGIKATERHTFGQDIDAACGQLATKNKVS